MEEVIRGVVLGGINYGENDKILNIFTLEKGILSPERASLALRRLSHLLSFIYRDKFDQLQTHLERLFGYQFSLYHSQFLVASK